MFKSRKELTRLRHMLRTKIIVEIGGAEVVRIDLEQFYYIAKYGGGTVEAIYGVPVSIRGEIAPP